MLRPVREEARSDRCGLGGAVPKGGGRLPHAPFPHGLVAAGRRRGPGPKGRDVGPRFWGTRRERDVFFPGVLAEVAGGSRPETRPEARRRVSLAAIRREGREQKTSALGKGPLEGQTYLYLFI